MEDINEYKIRECYVKLTRLSAQEYKIAQESTWLKLHNIHECHVVLNRLSERDCFLAEEGKLKLRKLQTNKEESVRSLIPWIPKI